ncbi:MAG: beta-lactamase family protein [Gemmatimonadota bacterium]|nr:beta-lactamase family protein [Gemmatimonadota bacterium]
MNRHITLVSAAALALATPMMGKLHAQSPATRRAHELVALIGSATPASIKAYVDSAFSTRMRGLPMQAHINFFMGQHEQTGGLDWVDVQTQAPTRTTALVKRKLTGELMALLVDVEDAAPYRVAGVGQQRPQPKMAVAEPRLTNDADMAAALQQYVGTLAKADLFSGTVLLAKDGKTIYTGAFGQANKDFNAPNNIDTKFNLGSMNKMFTAVTIAQLVEQGKLSYDDPLSKFIPDFPNAAAAQKIRIKHLLTHTAGLGSYFNDEFEKSSRARYRTVDEMLQLARGDSLAFEPGTRWSYSNTGMLVLGKVIEVVTKQDYFDYVREHLYKPAGMASTDAYELDRVNPNLAVGYQKEYAEDGTKRFRNNIFMHVIRGGPAGGGYSTAGDLLRFAEALKGGTLIRPATFELMTTPKPGVKSPEYGYGFGVDPQTNIVGHSGGFPGISSNLDVFKGTGYVAVVMSNYGGASQPVVEKIRTLVRQRIAPTP